MLHMLAGVVGDNARSWHGGLHGEAEPQEASGRGDARVRRSLRQVQGHMLRHRQAGQGAVGSCAGRDGADQGGSCGGELPEAAMVHVDVWGQLQEAACCLAAAGTGGE